MINRKVPPTTISKIEEETTGVSIEDFAADVLAPWFSDNDDWCSDRKVFTSPRASAAHVSWWALTHPDKKGLVHLLATDAPLAKEAKDFVLAFFEHPMLAAQVRRVTPDGVMLRSGVSIQCTSNVAKRPTNILHAIRLTSGPEIANVEPTPQELAAAVIHAAHDNAPLAKHVTSLLDLQPDVFTSFWEQRIQEAKAGCKQEARRELKPRPLPAPVRTVLPSLDVLEDGVGDDGYYTDAYEEANAQHKTDRALNGGRPRVLRQRPGNSVQKGPYMASLINR